MVLCAGFGDRMAMVELCVATDLSPAAAPAVDLAFRWAHALQATLVLLHVVHDPVLAPALSSDVPGQVAAARKELQQRAAAASDVTCRIVVKQAEDVVQAIVDASRGADYLLVGSHGRSGLQRLALGSVASAVLRKSHVPVVCLPPPGR